MEAVENERAGRFAVKAAARSFFFPFVAVAVAVEADRLAGLDVLAEHVENGAHLRCSGGDAGIDARLEVGQSLCHGCVEGNHCAGAVGNRAYGAKLKAVAREGEGRSAQVV